MKFVMAATVLALGIHVSCDAQTRSVRDSSTAYGARLTAKGQPANLNESRINSRVNSRIDNRISLRIERYRPDTINNPTASFQTTQTDNSRTSNYLSQNSSPQGDGE